MTRLKYLIKIVAIFLWSTNIRADYPFADEVSEEWRNNSCYMQSYGIMKYLKGEEGKNRIDRSYRLANQKAKEWASDAQFVKFCFNEPAEGWHQLEYLFTSESKGERYLYFFERGGGIPSPGCYGDEVKTGFTGDYIPIDTSKWEVSIIQVWEKILDTFKAKGVWNSKFSQVAGLAAYAILEMMNTDTLVWEIELFGTSVPSGMSVNAGFTMDAGTGAIIRDKPITQELLHKGEMFFREKDYCNTLKTYEKLRRYGGGISRDEKRERMIECMKKLEGKLPEIARYAISDRSHTIITESFVIRDSCWKNPMYYETEDRGSVRVTCKIYGALGYRKKLTGKLPEYSVKVLKQKGVKKFDFAIQVKVGLDGKIEVRKHPIFLVGTGYTDWSYEIVKLLNETWRWQPLPVTTKGIIYFQFRPCES